MAHALFFARAAVEGIISVPVQRIVPERAQDLHEARNALDPGDPGDRIREDRRRVAALQLHIQDQVDQFPVDLFAQLIEAALRVHGPLFKIHRNVFFDVPQRIDRDIGAEQLTQLSHRIGQADDLKCRLEQVIPRDQAELMGLHIREH